MFATIREVLARRDRLAGAAILLAAQMGREALDRLAGAAYIVAIAASAAVLALHRATWKRTVCTVFMRQVLFTAVDAVGVSLRIGGAVGVLLFVEAANWLDELGTTAEAVAPWMMAFTVRELAPLIANLIVIGRSGVAIATELANMKLHGELDVLDAQGIDVMTYLVVPRVVSAALCVMSLGVVLVAAIFVSGYAVGYLTNAMPLHPGELLESVVAAAGTEDLVCFLAKTIVTGWFVGAICCREGLRVRAMATEVPSVASRSGVRSLTAVFMVNAALSLIIHGQELIVSIL
jgi:phospholipid/cholesterol/gamma-HCH transport system permease protein